jgi:GT2 family glycosyltransferase
MAVRRGSSPIGVAIPHTSLIISSRNRPLLLAETVASILAADEVPSELIVIDQSDAPNATLEHLVEPACEVRYIWAPSIGASLGRNLGVARAIGEIVAFIDDDMQVDPGWFGASIRVLVASGPRAAVTGRVSRGPPETPGGFVAAVHDWQEPRVYAGRIRKDVLATGHMAMYRTTFERVGRLDERLGPGTRFPGAEDNDLGFRLLEAGCHIVYVPESIIHHRAWRTQSHYVPLFWRYGRGQGAFYAKHLTLRDHYMLRRLWQDVWRYVRLLPRRLRHRQLLELSGATAFLAGILSGGTEWLLFRRRMRA